MATLTPTFQAESARIHEEHHAFVDELTELERQLDHLDCDAQGLVDLNTAVAVTERGWKIVRELPEHCLREEAQLLDPVSEVSAELAEFTRQMRREHHALLAHLETFRCALDDLENSPDLPAAVHGVKTAGGRLARHLRRHIETEENELSGFL